MERVTSRQNPVVKRFREAAARPTSDAPVLLEGARLVQEALQSGMALETVAVTGDTHAGLAEEAERAGARVLSVSLTVLAAISPARQPSGVVALARRPADPLAACLARHPALLVVIGGLQDGGNVGAIIRTAEAAGATAVLCSERTAHPFGWKALRGAMGSTFRMLVAAGHPLAEIDAALRAHAVARVATVPRGGTPLRSFDMRGPVAILLGAEGGGLDAEVERIADARLSVPMRPPVESLNVAVTAALVLYEAARQRELS